MCPSVAMAGGSGRNGKALIMKRTDIVQSILGARSKGTVYAVDDARRLVCVRFHGDPRLWWVPRTTLTWVAAGSDTLATMGAVTA